MKQCVIMKKSDSIKFEKWGLKPFEDILEACKKIAKSWGTDYVPLDVLKNIIIKYQENTKIIPDSMEDIRNAYKNLYETLYNTCLYGAKKMNSENVPISYLEKCILIIKISWEEGFTKKEK